MDSISLNTSSRRRNSIETSYGKARLSELPSHLLCRILSELSTKDSVRTSVLSIRWRYLWLHVPALDLDFHDFENYLDLGEFIDIFMKSNPELVLKRFKLIYDADEHCHDDFVWRLNEVVKRGVSHLSIMNMVEVDQALVRMPLALYSCASLVELTLYSVVFDHPESELVSLPSLKTMYIEAVKFDGESILETLISSCLVLEDLTVITYPDDCLGVVCVRSQSLKSFTLESQRLDGEDPNVEIDAPKLAYMSISGYRPESFIIHKIGPFAKVNVDVVFDVDHDDPLEITKIRSFLVGISAFHEMTISAPTLESIHAYSKVEVLPQLYKLARLDVSLINSRWEFLPAFLGCCMNLHTLILELGLNPEIEEEIKLSPVPRCVLSSLNFLWLRTPNTPSKKTLASYFMKNCPALRKLLLCKQYYHS